MLNKVILIGRLCTDPELKYTPSGVAVLNCRIAVDRNYANAQGERETDFIDIVAWRQQAEFVNKYITKGRLIAVEGSLQIRQWLAPDGQKRRSAEVVADSVQPLDRPRERDDAGANAAGTAAPRTTGAPRREDTAPPQEAPDYDVPDITDPFADQ
jgi:single-strand DNA-binding protein